MNYWRMAFRDGTNGLSLWPQCFKLGIAAITYYPIEGIDLSPITIDSINDYLFDLYPTQKASIKRIRYEMKKGDVIYVKEGPLIVGKGIIESKYFYDHNHKLVCNELSWPHQVKVKWLSDFNEVKVKIPGEKVTIFPIDTKYVNEIENRNNAITKESNKAMFSEGDTYLAELKFRARNVTLIKIKKSLSDYKCEVCKFDFKKHYGEIGDQFIEAHHLKPISAGSTKNSLEDIALLCSNCHSMIHKKNPPFTLSELKNEFKK